MCVLVLVLQLKDADATYIAPTAACRCSARPDKDTYVVDLSRAPNPFVSPAISGVSVSAQLSVYYYWQAICKCSLVRLSL